MKINIDRKLENSTNEAGKINILALGALVAVTYLVKEYSELFLSKLELYQQVIVGSVIGIFVLYNFLSFLYSFFSGEKSKLQMKYEIKKESVKLIDTLSSIEQEIAQIKVDLKKLTGTMRPEGFRELINLESLVSSLGGRLKKVGIHSTSKDVEEIHYAYINLLDDLRTADDALTSLILTDELETVPYRKIRTDLVGRIDRVRKLFPASRSRGATAL